jgi:hypothetical protein
MKTGEIDKMYNNKVRADKQFENMETPKIVDRREAKYTPQGTNQLTNVGKAIQSIVNDEPDLEMMDIMSLF